MIARHFCLVGHYHGTTITLESHAASGLVSLCDQCLVAEQIHCGLTVQNGFVLKLGTGHRDLQVQHQHETQEKWWYHGSDPQGKKMRAITKKIGSEREPPPTPLL